MSKRILILAPYPFNEAPSQRFRFEQYLSYFNQVGISFDFRPFLSQQTWKTLYESRKTTQKIWGVFISFVKRWSLMFTLRKYDFVFIHREAAHIGPPVFEWIIAKVWRKKIIYDFDDAIWLANYSESNAKFHRLKAYWKVNYCMKWAYKVSAGNDYLAKYASQFNKNVEIIPTTIDTINLHNINTDYDQERVVIGWTGTHTTMHYLDFLVPVIKELEKTYTFDFLIISNEAPTYHLNSLKFLKWKKETEIQDLSKISIGVMPLENDIWAEGKCGFKGLQYMALGIPALMSPIGVNNQIIEHAQNGYLLKTAEEWKEHLALLLQDKTLRMQIGKSGKQTIDERYSVLSNQEKYLALFS
ncbi:MAG: glycosyltransferase [Bacteroidetes bacterium]|nr:glycosyltransferase [Bacteroidota bacterium]